MVSGVCFFRNKLNKYKYHMTIIENINHISGDNLLCTNGFVET